MGKEFAAAQATGRLPNVTVRTQFVDAAVDTDVNDPILIAPKLDAGQAINNELQIIGSPSQADTAFGLGSVAGKMTKAALANNPSRAVKVFPHADGGTKRVAAFIFAANATEAFTVTMRIGSDVRQAQVAAGALASTIPALCTAAAGGATEDLLFTVSAGGSAGLLLFTARNGGTVMNDVPVEVEIPAAVGTTVTASNTDTITGTGSFDYTTIADDLVGLSGDFFVPADHTNARATINTLIDNSWNSGVSFPFMLAVRSGTITELNTLAGTLNNTREAVVGINDQTQSPPFEVAAAIASKINLSARSNAAVGYNGLVLNGVIPPALVNRFTRSQKEALLDERLGVICTLPDGSVEIGRIPTSYDDANIFFPLSELYTLVVVQRALRNGLQQFIQGRVFVDDGQEPGAVGVTRDLIRARTVGIYNELAALQLVTDVDGFASTVRVLDQVGNPNAKTVHARVNVSNALTNIAIEIALQR